MPTAESISHCPICGNHVHQVTRGRARKFCSRKCSQLAGSRAQAERLRIAADDAKQMVPCPVCGTEFKKKYNKIYCSDYCKDKARRSSEGYKEKSIEYGKKWYKNNAEKARAEAIERYNKRKKNPEEYKKIIEAKKEWRINNPDAVAKHRAKERIRRSKHDAHVKAWIANLRNQQTKHDSHVSVFKAYLRSASAGMLARFYKSIGQPWRNPRLSDALQYKIRYRLDLAFRLSEVNRLGWRKETLAARDDGTANFWALLRERKTCPYCGKRITKENAVADHMDPLKRGGANGQHNLTICCKDCNKAKGAKPYLTWVATLPEHRQRPALLWYKRKHGYLPDKPNLSFSFVFAG